jgi:hypothetical protein
MDADVDQLQRAVEKRHGGKAVLAGITYVPEGFEGLAVHHGVVYTFDVEGLPRTTRAYAWSSPDEGNDELKFYVVLHLGEIRSAIDALRATLLDDRRRVERSASAATEAEARRDADLRDILGMGSKK